MFKFLYFEILLIFFVLWIIASTTSLCKNCHHNTFSDSMEIKSREINFMGNKIDVKNYKYPFSHPNTAVPLTCSDIITVLILCQLRHIKPDLFSVLLLFWSCQVGKYFTKHILLNSLLAWLITFKYIGIWCTGTVCLQLGCEPLIPEGSASGWLCPAEELGNAWRRFWLSQLASSMGRLRMSLNTLQCTGQSPIPIKS